MFVARKWGVVRTWQRKYCLYFPETATKWLRKYVKVIHLSTKDEERVNEDAIGGLNYFTLGL